MKKLFKIIILIFLLILLFNIFIPKNVYAAPDDTTFSFGKIMEDFRNFIKRPDDVGKSDLIPEMAKDIQPIINTLYWVGIAIIIGAAMFLGVEYFKATGDPKQKAELQQKFVGFLISSAVLIAAYPIWSFLVSFVSSLIK